AGGRRQQAGGYIEQCRLAATRRPHDRHELAGCDDQRRVADGNVVGVRCTLAPVASRESAGDVLERKRGRLRRQHGYRNFCAAFCAKLMLMVFARSTVALCTPGSNVFRSRYTLWVAAALMMPSCLNGSRLRSCADL